MQIIPEPTNSPCEGHGDSGPSWLNCFTAFCWTPANIKQKLLVLSWVDKSLSCEKCSLGMSGCSSGYIPFSLAASPFLKVVGKTMFVKWKIKENMATRYFHSHIANHDGASCINGIKSYWELLSMKYYHASLWKNIADFSTRNSLLIVQIPLSWTKFQSSSWKWHLRPLRTMDINLK